jgi:hypothetical protein
MRHPELLKKFAKTLLFPLLAPAALASSVHRMEFGWPGAPAELHSMKRKDEPGSGEESGQKPPEAIQGRMKKFGMTYMVLSRLFTESIVEIHYARF